MAKEPLSRNRPFFYSLTLETVLGPLTLRADSEAIFSVDFYLPKIEGEQKEQPNSVLLKAAKQIDAYFKGQRRHFDLPIKFHGSSFQQSVWQKMREIPYGRTCTYGDLAHMLSTAPRAIGGACARNHLLLLVPCHRIVAAYDIGGYGSRDGILLKRKLMRIEGIDDRRWRDPQ